jgi:hypothetical protein
MDDGKDVLASGPSRVTDSPIEHVATPPHEPKVVAEARRVAASAMDRVAEQGAISSKAFGRLKTEIADFVFEFVRAAAQNARCDQSDVIDERHSVRVWLHRQSVARAASSATRSWLCCELILLTETQTNDPTHLDRP